MKAARRIDFDAVVVGAGMVGASTAALLAADPRLADWRIALVDPAPPPVVREGLVDLRVSALSRASEKILRACGAWAAIEPHAGAYGEMRIWDASGTAYGTDALHFEAAETAEANLGYIVENSRVQCALLDALAGQGRVTRFGTGLAGFDISDAAARLELADGRQLDCTLLIGADGANSRTRELGGIERSGADYAQHAIVTHLTTQRAHCDTAWQRFLPGGPIALLPLRDGRVSLVWTLPTADAERLLALEDAGFSAQVETACDSVLGALTVSAPRASFALGVWSAREYCRDRLVLVGDAAHTVHPLAGQGVNLGFLDAASLVQVLAEAVERDQDPASLRVLRRYERWRRSENALMIGLTDGLNQLFGLPGVGAASLRRAGLGLVGSQPMLRRRLAAHALGTAGDVPELVARA